ncbi:MAG: hypothetical protein CM15mP84_09620 [Cellvibrionales bacterium]|nr:MAG: hypothetical protein CM15mP84_09620 [Cellvibrionales bacterium]
MGALFDQDAGNLPEVQRGLMASKSRKAITASYQNCEFAIFRDAAKYLAAEINGLGLIRVASPRECPQSLSRSVGQRHASRPSFSVALAKLGSAFIRVTHSMHRG